ncbi:F510_1955 family glycosylhydrolase [Halalkalibacter urbisdiaboli]|uniref:F510_1955 family glycosylhydrolase n=1 Tax=Halalkalibacter urbisdiaboli TaxID=1960589 RepID=UPI000B44FCDF|nr:YCF48-related protein [Halalkalibacter urbisdiaboli]
MLFRRNINMLLIVLLLSLLTACAQGEEQGIENEQTGEVENDAEVEVDLETEHQHEHEKKETMFQHVHGLAYELSEPYDLHLGTHHGVFRINPDNVWRWLGTNKHRHDVMGFTFLDEETMISSGHPSEASNLKNPIGVIISKDQAETWEPIALHGEVDFHTFEVNASQSGVLYGIDMSGFYRSEDFGYNWELVRAKGLPENPQDIYTLVSNPGQPSALLAGTKFGIYQSDDGGETWGLATDEETLISAKAAYEQEGTIVAYVQGKNENGLVKSTDFGSSWTSLNLQFDDDAVAHIAVHPVNEGEFAVGTFKGDLYRTIDNGVNWQVIAKEGKSIVD